MDPIVVILLVLLVILIGAVAIVGQRTKPGSRGSAPGKGDHVLRSDYQSGMGGGHETSWTVPKDPQDYAKRFIPKGAKK